ncbi:MAG: hypothetical protein K6G88_05390 [Lachnospiraceae bacterium]|nr:hypothetical protein [Lachnospiraceae bacterium]
MATRSITKNIDIRDKKLGKNLIVALEHASGKKSKDVQLTRTCVDISGEQIKKLFGDNQ